MPGSKYVVVLALIVSLKSAHANPEQLGQFGAITRFSYGPDERRAAFNMRLASGYLRDLMQPINYLPMQNNGDEKTVANYAAQFSKTLGHGVDGTLTTQGQQSYRQLVTAMGNGDQSAYNLIVRAPGATIKLTNPQAGLAFCMEGCDSSLFSMPLFPQMNSPELAALMLECYLAGLCRDVVFSDYGTGQNSDANGIGGSLTNDAAAVLQSLGSAYTGPRNAQGSVDASVLFRGGDSYGSVIGQYVSQLALLPLKTPPSAGSGFATLNQAPFIKLIQQWPIAQQREFGVAVADMVAIQNGIIPKQYLPSDYDAINKRYIIDGRDWGSFVHFDINCESFFYATYILNGYGFPYSAALPYYNGAMNNESSFITMGMIEVFGMVEAVAVEAIKAAWAQKWRANRALRPEALSLLVNNVKMTGLNPYNLDSSLFTSHAGVDVWANVLAKNILQASYPANNLSTQEAATYTFAQMYPEGSPAHPTYPSGHATIAGACATVLKAYFQNSTLISSIVAPVAVDPTNSTQLIPYTDPSIAQMTVATEIDKLASNVAMARTFAGVHFRADGDQGILLGEDVAIKFLQDRAMLYNEQDFAGWILTKRDGTIIRITGNGVTTIVV